MSIMGIVVTLLICTCAALGFCLVGAAHERDLICKYIFKVREKKAALPGQQAMHEALILDALRKDIRNLFHRRILHGND